MRYWLYVLLFAMSSSSGTAQVVFTRLPKPLQLFPRDSANYGHFEIEGKSPFAFTVTTIVSEELSGALIETFTRAVNANELFRINHNIPACLKEYALEIFITDPFMTGQRVEHIHYLVAGDVFVVDGQSNAECPLSPGVFQHDSTYQSAFTRVIGANFSWATSLTADSIHPTFTIEQDSRFARPSSYAYFMNGIGYSGIWPMRLQCELARQTGIPNCLINGSRGNTEISAHLASHTPSHPDSLIHSPGPKNATPALIYDRIFKKIYANNAIAGVKGIFWYQGESDGIYNRDSSFKYHEKFGRLYSSWKADYPSLKKIFVLQINLGCGGDYQNLIREVQRKLPEDYKDVVVMSTVGSSMDERMSDLCHYTVEGYSKIAAKLLPLVKKYIYDFPLKEDDILPANIQKAYYADKQKIHLVFDKAIFIQDSCIYMTPDTGTAYLKDYFFNEDGSPVKLNSVDTDNNKLVIHLDTGQALVTKISFLPNIFSTIPSLYSGPWILNATNHQIGAYAFAEIPVEKLKVPKAEEKMVLVYPNPSQDKVNFKFRDTAFHKISVYDLYGKCLLTTATHVAESTIDVEHWNAGIYLCRIESSGETFTVKLAIE